MNYKSHPLLRLSEVRYSSDQPLDDKTSAGESYCKPENGLLRFLKARLYPILNSIAHPKNLRGVDEMIKETNISRIPDIVLKGHRGFSQEIFLKRLSSIVDKPPHTVLSFGCGAGKEVLNIARILGPERIIGIDYFNYRSAWNTVSEEVLARYGVECDFYQFDTSKLPSTLVGCADIVYSHSVLEHIRDMDDLFPLLRTFLKRDGYFAAQWGPMWYSFSGDHIAGELGLEKGFEHIRLSHEEYLDFYTQHPRNVNDVRQGIPTWLELGLHNFAKYEEYLGALMKYFGDIKFLQWVLSMEAIDFKKKYRQKWESILDKNRHVTSLDLVLQCAGIVLR